MTLFQPGSCEPQKCAVHRGIMLLAGLCAVYNGTAFVQRREPRLAVMALFYASLTGLEWHICGNHVRKP